MRRLLSLSVICISALLCVTVVTFADDCEHNWSNWEYSDTQDCTTGVYRYRDCDKCGAIEDETIYEHSWSKWETIYEPDCLEEGLQSHYCTICGAYEEEIIPATGNHQWSSWKTLTGATIYRTGIRTHYCLDCYTEQDGVIGKLSPFARFTQGKYTLYKGSKMQMRPALIIASGDAVKSWKTSKKRVVSITKAGKIKAKKKGTAKITVTLKSGKKATCTIKVVKKPKKKSSGGSVYITRTGIRYHCNKNCWGLRNANALYKVTLSTAKKKGLTPCLVCY